MNSPSESTRKRSISLAVKIVIALSTFVGLLILAFIIWRGTLASANGKRLQAIKAASEPAGTRELDAWYEAVDDQENAALVWLDGIVRLSPKLEKDQQSPWSKIKLPPRNQRLTQSQLGMATEILEANKEALAFFRRAAPMTKSRFPVDFSQGMFADLGHLTQLKAAGQLLQLESLVHAQNGRGGEAAESIRAILGAGRSLAQEPLLLSQLVRASVDNIAMFSAERTLNLTPLNEQQLAALQGAFAAAETPDLSERALMGERAIGTTMMNSPHEITPPPDNEEAAENARAAQAGFGSSLMRLTGFFQRDLGFFLDAMGTNIAIAKMPDPQKFLASTNADSIPSQARRGFYVMSSLLLPAFSKAFLRDAEHSARVRVAQTAMAVERYRLANQGQFPATLATLVPKYLEAVPVDPFDGEPLRFKTLPGGYVVYSIGQDATDDEGTPLPSGNRAAKEPHDITFIMEK